jgi:hypothetical protein
VPARPGGPAAGPDSTLTLAGGASGEGSTFADWLAAQAAPPADPPAAPARLGPYHVRGLLGRGGMGAVLAADDPALGRPVAVKVMLPHRAADPAARARFLREARAAAAVRHDHVVPIFHVGEQDGAPYLVMPLLDGESLAARLARGPLPPAEVARVGREAALGLAAAHARGLIHRDVKPDNLWLEAPAGRVLVLDFGLARDPDAEDRLTQPGAVFGTAAYMAPEQADGGAVDARADLFALGATLYECATGVSPFRRPTLTATLRAVADHAPPPPREVNPAVPPALSGLIERLLAKRPADRPPSAAAVADELAALASGAPGAAATAGFAPVGVSRRLTVGCTVTLTLSLLVGLGLSTLLAPMAQVPVMLPGGPDVAPSGPTRAPAHPDRPASEAAPPPLAPVAVTRLEVRPHRHLGGGRYQPLLLLGYDGNPGATTDEAVTVAATLSRPAYCYLVVFRADGADDVLYPQDPDDVPPRTDRPVYPSKRRDAVYGLDDGPGLWAVAAVTSDDPLPGYRAWRARHPGGPWQPQPTPPAAVVLDDGREVEAFAPGRPSTRGGRGEKAAADRAPVVGLVDWLKGQTGSPAAALTFPVWPAK